MAYYFPPDSYVDLQHYLLSVLRDYYAALTGHYLTYFSSSNVYDDVSPLLPQTMDFAHEC